MAEGAAGGKMAESEAKQQTDTVQDGVKKLEYLDFVQVAAIYVLVCFSSVYEFAKENSGPLKPGVLTVEGTVKTVIAPVYEKFHDVPFELLKFFDRKVSESLSEMYRHVPSPVKHACIQAGAVACEVQRAGVVDTGKNITKRLYTKYRPTARELYFKYEPAVEKHAVSAWRMLNRLPLFPQLAQIAVPTAAYWAGKYNRAVCFGADREYPVAFYLPLIPIARIAKVFQGEANGPTVTTNGNAVTAH